MAIAGVADIAEASQPNMPCQQKRRAAIWNRS